MTDQEILAMYSAPWPLELVLMSVLSADILSDTDRDDLRNESLPFLESLAARYEAERDSLSPLMIGFGVWALGYYIPTPETLDRYPALETIYRVMKNRLNPSLVAMREAHRPSAR